LHAVAFENTDQSVVSLQAWAIAPSGRVTESQKKDISTQAAYATFELFSDARVKYVAIPGAEEGSLVGYEVVTSGRLPLHGHRFSFEDEIPVKQSELHVAVPAGTFRWFTNHPDRVEVVSQSPTEATFRTSNRPAITREDGAPPFQTLAAE